MAYQIFETADGQRTALYAQGNSVFSCQLPFMRGMTPKELRADYLAHLDAVLFRDTVCFVYENLEHQVVIDTLGGSPARILLADIPDGYRFEGLQLIERENGLYLFYQICGRGEKARIKGRARNLHGNFMDFSGGPCYNKREVRGPAHLAGAGSVWREAFENRDNGRSV